MEQKRPDDRAETAGQQIAQEIEDEANTTMPGGRAALPTGTLRPLHQTPQADEHRDETLSSNNETHLPSTPPLVD